MEHIGNNKVDVNAESGKPRLFITTGNQSLTKGRKRHRQKNTPFTIQPNNTTKDSH